MSEKFTLRPSPVRRWFAWTTLVALGVLLVALAFSGGIVPVWQAALVLLGVLALWMAERLRRATARGIVLTDAGLFEEGGREIALFDQIRRVERGAFAFKPSAGFLLVLNERRERAWAPGLWWRTGRRVGVGGVTNSGAARYVAEEIATRIKQRSGR